MSQEWSTEDKNRLLKDIQVVRKLHARFKSVEDISDMLEHDYAFTELIVQLIEDGFYDRDEDLMEAVIVLYK